MAACALQSLCLSVDNVAVDGLRDVFVAMAASRFGYLVVEVGDPDDVRVVPCSEIERMEESVRSLNRIFADDIVRRVAIVAGRHRMMARLDPCVILRLHDVAICASLRVICEVGVALGVNECIQADTDDESGEYRNDQSQRCRSVHEFVTTWQGAIYHARMIASCQKSRIMIILKSRYSRGFRRNWLLLHSARYGSSASMRPLPSIGRVPI